MKNQNPVAIYFAVLCLIFFGEAFAQFTRVSSQASIAGAPAVTSPPESFFKIIEKRLSRSGPGGRSDNEVPGVAVQQVQAELKIYRDFYQKYIDVQGMPVVASAEVADLALQRTYDIVTHILAGRPDVVKAMVDQGMYLIVIGKDQLYTDMPDYRRSPNPDFQNERVRGTGGLPTSFGEENLLSLPSTGMTMRVSGFTSSATQSTVR